MKELILENPPRKKGRKSKKRRSAAQRAATRRMLAANRAKRAGRKSAKRRKSVKRRSTKRHSVKRRVSRKRSTARTFMSRTRKSTRRRKASRRRKTHTYLVRGTASPIKLNGMLGSVFSKDNLTIAGGAVAATVVTNYALNSGLAQKLPGLANPYARAAYMLLVPVVGGILAKRLSPNLAKGMVIGGLANGIAQLVTASKVLPAGQAVPTVTTTAPAAITSGTGEYLGEYLGAYGAEEEAGSVAGFADSAWN